MSDLLESLDLDAEKAREIIVKLYDDGFPCVANAMHAMHGLNLAAEEAADGLFDEALEMRRSHLAVTVAVIDNARGQLATLLDNLGLEERLPNAELDKLSSAQDAFDATGTALAEVVQALTETPERNR